MNIRRLLALVMAASVSPNPGPGLHSVLGVVLSAKRVHLNNVAATPGATVYDGDGFSTEAGGLLRLRSGPAIIELLEESEVLVRSRRDNAPGTEVTLNKGTLAFSTQGGYTIEMHTLGARICPAGDARTVAQIRVTGPKELLVYARRGALQFSYGEETETLAEGKSYRVMLDPPNNGPKEEKPIHPGQWPKGFKIAIIGEGAAVLGLGIYELLEPESPDRP